MTTNIERAIEAIEDEHDPHFGPIDAPSLVYALSGAGLLMEDLPAPEDVPAGEPWIVRHEAWEWIGLRSRSQSCPWSITRVDGLGYRDVSDSDITLISRLVPEVKP